jgi:carboxypeptidase C (cathepsin A)
MRGRGSTGAGNRGHARFAAAAILLLALPALAAEGDPKPPQSTKPPPATEAPRLPGAVETKHAIALGQRSLDYRAIAEPIALSDAKGTQTASIFTVSYLVEPQQGQLRPVAFLFNGGPGAASAYLHLGAVGPRIMEPQANGVVPGPPVRLVDNPATWLDFTDLVFIDPVGTGFSRGEGRDDNPNKPFFNVNADIAALDSVVRLWLTKHQRWASPIYLVGESYGGFRVAAMAKSLAHDDGIVPSGVVMVSPALDTALLNADVLSLAGASVELPSYAATAAAFAGGSGFDPSVVEHFALTDYLVGLATMKGVPAPGDPFIAKIAAMIGLPEDIVRRERGWVGAQVFTHELRRGQNEVLSLYDATISRPSPANPWDNTAGDPILENATQAYTAAFNAYVAGELNYHTELPYRVLSRDVNRQWEWEGAHHGEDGLGLALSGLQTALLEHPATKILIANGRYDLVTPYFSSRWLVDQLAVPAAAREAIRLKVYDGGHMMYLRPQSRDALAADARELFTAAPR